MRSAGTLPSAGFFVLFRLIVMPLDGEEHARAQHDNLERKDDYGEQVYPIQIHHFKYFQAVTRHYRYDERYLKTDASTTSIQALMQCLFDAAQLARFVWRSCVMPQRFHAAYTRTAARASSASGSAENELRLNRIEAVTGQRRDCG
jgi:hypothetical protein